MATYALNDAKMFCDIADGIAIVINSETGIYYGMNGFGTHVFENILNGVDISAIEEAIKLDPDAPEDMDDRLTLFVDTLRTNDLILPVEAQGEAKIDPEIAKNDNFILEIKEYNDAQELLLADPIHEVKEDTGWTPEKESIETDKELVKAKESKME